MWLQLGDALSSRSIRAPVTECLPCDRHTKGQFSRAGVLE